ncbi:chromatin assembly factor 1 subunit B [Cydia pomonella]|uniref:chromatin assembly factor 1 subunit B n=1 Tax=Cydia pomonella TaxID=82600 RepID=UPI002ADE4F46|nr:chromatin assembly factor 1 subunit B [Cydia pomonella]
MKFAIPEISWHNRDPVLSVDFQPKTEPNGPLRLATGGTDSHVLIWYVSPLESGSVNLEVAADLTRHQKAVNVVRWSPSGQYLASGDDESIIFVWQQKTEKDSMPTDPNEEQYKETWVIYKTLRGHLEDVLDLSWASNSLHLASGSVDNKLVVWDVSRGKYSSILSDHKGFVQGVAWDPKGQLIATASSDRVFRTFDITTKKVASRSSKAALPFPAAHPLHGVPARLFHDDTLQTYYRRLQFSPDGMLIAVPAGRIEAEVKTEIKPINAVYIYTRYSLKVPACVLPCGEPALATRWSPVAYGARAAGPRGLALRRRLLLAVATRRSVMLYDTQQRTPVAVISNIHYTRLTDLSWSPDGRMLVASSTDGYCSVVSFAAGELGPVLPDAPDDVAEQMEIDTEEQAEADKAVKDTKTVDKKEEPTQSPKSKTRKIDSFIKFKAPSEKSPKKRKCEPEQKTPVKIDLLVETAMPSWSDNSSNEIIKPPSDKNSKDEVMVIEDSEDIKLVYEETEQNKSNESQSPTKASNTKSDTPDSKMSNANLPEVKVSPKNTMNSFLKQAKVTDMKDPVAVASAPSPKAPRRVSFVTLSSPKNSKKKL